MNRDDVLTWLKEGDPRRLDSLWRRADRGRAEAVGDAVHLRGLVEISNHCARRCLYCGLRADRADLPRYRMDAREVLACAHRAVALGYGTLVLQSGEDDGLTREGLADLIRRLKAETPLAVTLSLGERPDADLAAWRQAGADRYLLRFETSNRALYDRIHPPRGRERSDRFERLARLRDLGYETGGGVMVGIPGQTYADLADDVEAFRALDLDMIGIGPFIAHPATPLGRRPQDFAAPDGDQAPATVEMACKMVALARLVCPLANIPSTTALATADHESGRELGLARGANVVMPNLTPLRYRTLYEIYPGKAVPCEAADADADLRRRLAAIGRTVGSGPGESPNRERRRPAGCAARQVGG